MQRGQFIRLFDRKRLIQHLFCSTYWSRSLIIFNHPTNISMGSFNYMNVSELHCRTEYYRCWIYWQQFVRQSQIASRTYSSPSKDFKITFVLDCEFDWIENIRPGLFTAEIGQKCVDEIICTVRMVQYREAYTKDERDIDILWLVYFNFLWCFCICNNHSEYFQIHLQKLMNREWVLSKLRLKIDFEVFQCINFPRNRF